MANLEKNKTENENEIDNARLIRLLSVMDKTGISKSYIYVLVKQGLFPKPVKLSERSVAWVESEIQQWIDDRINQRNKAEVK